ncbi:MAG: class I SAM-dependent methyltransferase [Thiogranum sp.]
MICSVCGGTGFSLNTILWEQLVRDWQLSPQEEEYVNRQQGLSCDACGSNLRSIALAKAILDSYSVRVTLREFVQTDLADGLRVLEINPAGSLTRTLEGMEQHRLVSYPDYDMTRLDIETSSVDLVIHSDTLEHIHDPVAGLTECRRILAENGRCIFTVPVIVDRFSRSRRGLAPSFHGSEKDTQSDYLVHTEFGADVWKYALQAGFASVTLHCIEYPAGLAIEAR